MLRVVSGGLDRLPAGDVAGPVARGRVLILIAAVLAAGLVYVNVGALEAGDSLGRSSLSAAELQRENTQLRAKIAQLGSTDRIQKRAAKLGLQMPVPEQFTFVRADAGDPLRATRTYTAPQPAPPPALGPSAATGLAVGQAPVTTGPTATLGAPVGEPEGAGAPVTGTNTGPGR